MSQAFEHCRKASDVRLRILDTGHRLPQRLALAAMRLVGRTDPDPVAKLALYRPEFFGRSWMHFIEAVMRGPSEWSDAERELMAAFVSRLNECPFCVGIHECTTTLLSGSSMDADRLERWREADFESRIVAMFELLEKVTLSPKAVGPSDMAPLLEAGLSRSAIADGLNVCFLFNTVNRLANAFDFRWRSEADRIKLARGLIRIRYHVPEFVLR